MRRVLIAFLISIFIPAVSFAADRVVTLPANSPFSGTVRLGAASGGPELRAVVPADVAEIVFTQESDAQPANAWFDRTYTAALKKNGFFAKDPTKARYELTAEVQSMTITPLTTGSHHKSAVIYRLKDIATGAQIWEQTQTPDFEITRGVRFGKIGRAIGGAVGGAVTGENPAVTATMINANKGKIRPFDIRIDVYEGIMRGFQAMAEKTLIQLAAFEPAP